MILLETKLFIPTKNALNLSQTLCRSPLYTSCHMYYTSETYDDKTTVWVLCIKTPKNIEFMAQHALKMIRQYLSSFLGIINYTRLLEYETEKIFTHPSLIYTYETLDKIDEWLHKTQSTYKVKIHYEQCENLECLIRLYIIYRADTVTPLRFNESVSFIRSSLPEILIKKEM